MPMPFVKAAEKSAAQQALLNNASLVEATGQEGVKEGKEGVDHGFSVDRFEALDADGASHSRELWWC